ncbi:MAG: alkaline phosphatase D family protein, partial [Flavobacteriales bacterium]
MMHTKTTECLRKLGTLNSLFSLFFLIICGIATAQYPEASATDNEYPFYHGVASGDALSDRVIIWTRVSAENPPSTIEVSYALSTNPDMEGTVQSGTFTTDADRDYTVKVDVTGLDADTWYYFQFEALNGQSAIGRTRTLPTSMDDVSDFRFALASCANYEGGYFNAYGDIAARNDLDAVFQVGDYIYEYGGGTYGNGVRFHLPNLEVITVEDYRARHSNYKLDEDLAAAHRQYPWYMSWDDHETVNNSYATGAQNHDPETEGDWIERRNAALQAYYEWNPVRDITFSETSVPAYRSIEVGDLAKFYILETRLNARSPEVPLPNVELLYEDPATYFADAANLFGIYTSNQASLDPSRTMLGDDQKAWLTGEFASSTAQWNVVVNQTVMASLPIADLTAPNEALGGASIADIFAAQTDGLDIGAAVFLSYDNWDGFAADRAWLYGTMNALDVSNPVVLTGDIHSSWANTLVDFLNPTETVGVEFVTTQIAGDVRSFGLPNDSVEALIPWVEYFNQVCNGYTVIDLDATRAQADYVNIQSTLGNIVAWNNPDGNTGIEDRENFTTEVDGSFLSFADSYRPIVAAGYGLDTLPRSIIEAPAMLPPSENDAPLAQDLEDSTNEESACGLFFSGYAEGSSNNKFLEIYNPTDASVDLSEYAFPNVSNAPSTPGEYEYWNAFPEGAVIESNGVFVIAHPDADASILAEADMTFQYLSNGDDGFGLVQGTENDYVIIDMIGNWDADPGSGWDVAGTTNGTKEHALIRKPNITSGNGGDWYASAGTTPEDSEWLVLERDDWTGLGSHDFSGECGAAPADGPFTMQIFHNNDTESNLLNADNFGHLLNSMRAEADDAGIPHITLHSGDITLPGISTNLFAASEFSNSLDALALDYLDYDALCIGNHEFDLCPDALASFIGLFPNSEPPFLNINLDFSAEPAMAALVELGRVVNSTVLDVAGQEVAVIGLVTPDLEAVTCIGATQVLTNLAELLQAEVDALTAQGINKIIVASHLQGLIAPEADGGGDYVISSAVSGVDVWIAGGGGNMLHNGDDIGDYQLDGPYPIITQDASGADLPIITTVSSYSYLGALRVTFDENGVVTDLHDGFSNTYAVDLSEDAPVDDFLYQNVVSEIEAIIAQAETVGYSEIDWDLRDAVIRSRESGFGNLVADAFLASGIAYAEGNDDVDTPVVAITNGGGLRTDFHWLTTASPEAPEEVTNVLIGEILPFDNAISVVEDVTTANLKLILENCVSQTVFDPTTGGVIADDGRFGHIAGMWFEYDIFGESYAPDAQGNPLVEGTRVLNAYLDDGTALILDGSPVEGVTIDIATNSFLATGGPAFSGGDYYPFDQVNADLIHVGDELYAQTLTNFITALPDSLVSASTYPSLPGYDEGRIRVVLPSCEDPNGCTYGCTDATACNYDDTASSNDGSCEFPEDNLNCDGSCVNDDDMDGVCNENEVAGCTDTLACNYSADATDDDGTCTYTGEGCSEPECDLFISEYGVGSGSNRWVEI